MKRYNYSKLLWTIREKGITQEQLAKAINISTAALYNKLSGITEFKQSEIEGILTLLRLPHSDIADYFFCENC